MKLLSEQEIKEEIYNLYYSGNHLSDMWTDEQKANHNSSIVQTDYLYNFIQSQKKAYADWVIGSDIPLRADIDEELLRYIPDMRDRSLEYNGISSSFTNLYTRQIIKSTQDAMRQRNESGE